MTDAAKTTRERQAAFRERKRRKGLVELRGVWIDPRDRAWITDVINAAIIERELRRKQADVRSR